MEWRKKIANHVPEEKLISKECKGLIELNRKQQTNKNPTGQNKTQILNKLIEKWGKKSE